MGERDISDVLRNEGVGAARAMHDEARPFENEGAAILNDVRAFLSRFIAYPSEHAKIAHVLWTAHTHLMDAWESTPRIAFLSPEPGSGKTRAISSTNAPGENCRSSASNFTAMTATVPRARM